MIHPLSLVVSLFPLIAIAAPATSSPAATPTTSSPQVTLSYATIIGSSTGGIDSFKGVPFAQAPVGQLRLRHPQPIDSTTCGGTIRATSAQACPQFTAQISPTAVAAPPSALLAGTGNQSLSNSCLANIGSAIVTSPEDCLTVTIQRPSTANANSKLPVVFWIYGGAFEQGSNVDDDASTLIGNGVAQGKPFVYVAVNYRLGGFGFLPGQEVLNAGVSNLGLLDQRLGLQWTADHIAAFGGDPSKVTIWGESAGSISVFDQMALYGGNYQYKGSNLFRAAIMDSGSITPADPVNCAKSQVVYNTVVSNAGCSAATDTLACLRAISYDTFLNAANSVPYYEGYNSLALSYLPRPDNKTLPSSPDMLASQGSFAPIPFIIGDQEDEGTIFAQTQSNITTTSQLVDYLTTIFWHNATRAQSQALVDQYPDHPSAGSPFRTGTANVLYPEYKRLAALLGDYTFSLQRRRLLQFAGRVYPNVSSWSYVATYNYGTPINGTEHSSDLPYAYGSQSGFPTATTQGYYLSFFQTMDPNHGTTSPGLINWPLWKTNDGTLVNFGATNNSLLADDFRAGAAAVLGGNVGTYNI